MGWGWGWRVRGLIWWVGGVGVGGIVIQVDQRRKLNKIPYSN